MIITRLTCLFLYIEHRIQVRGTSSITRNLNLMTRLCCPAPIFFIHLTSWTNACDFITFTARLSIQAHYRKVTEAIVTIFANSQARLIIIYVGTWFPSWVPTWLLTKYHWLWQKNCQEISKCSHYLNSCWSTVWCLPGEILKWKPVKRWYITLLPHTPSLQ